MDPRRVAEPVDGNAEVRERPLEDPAPPLALNEDRPVRDPTREDADPGLFRLVYPMRSS